MSKSKKLTVNGKEFKSQKEAKEFFYAIRDKYQNSQEEITASNDFDMLNDLYVRYCAVTKYGMKGMPISFYVRNIVRGNGGRYCTTRGFVVKFDNGLEEEFSARKAIETISNKD